VVNNPNGWTDYCIRVTVTVTNGAGSDTGTSASQLAG